MEWHTLTNTKVLWGGLEQGVLDNLGLTLREGGRGRLLTGLALGGLVIETESVE